MKKRSISSILTSLGFTVFMLFMSVSAFAQLDVDISVNEDKWYERPLVWAGVAVFVIILALILRRAKK